MNNRKKQFFLSAPLPLWGCVSIWLSNLARLTPESATPYAWATLFFSYGIVALYYIQIAIFSKRCDSNGLKEKSAYSTCNWFWEQYEWPWIAIVLPASFPERSCPAGAESHLPILRCWLVRFNSGRSWFEFVDTILVVQRWRNRQDDAFNRRIWIRWISWSVGTNCPQGNSNGRPGRRSNKRSLSCGV